MTSLYVLHSMWHAVEVSALSSRAFSIGSICSSSQMFLLQHTECLSDTDIAPTCKGKDENTDLLCSASSRPVSTGFGVTMQWGEGWHG